MLQLIDLGFPVVVALNLSDEARRRGVEPDAGKLARELGVPVVPTVAPRGEGLRDLREAVFRVAAAPGPSPHRHGRWPAPFPPVVGPARARAAVPTAHRAVAASPVRTARGTPLPAAIEARVRELAAVFARQGVALPRPLTPRAAALAVLEGDLALAQMAGLPDAALRAADDQLALAITAARHEHARRLAALAQAPPRRGDRLWRLATAPRTGLPLLLLVAAAMFATLFVVGDLLARVLTAAWTAWISPAVGAGVTALVGGGTAGRVVLWGVDGGILATLAVGIPYILTFYLILAAVEDTGYMNAAAFLSDRLLHRLGLHGRAVIPLIAAAGCNVPAILGTRILRTRRERLIASTLVTLMPCSARTAVIVGGVAAVAGWQYALLVYGIVLAVVVLAGLALDRLLPGEAGPLVMEMFPFRRPVLRQVLRKTWWRFREFVWDAAPLILVGSTALGLLYETGWVWHLEPVLAPVVEGWLLLPGVAGLTLLFAVLRKELAIQLLLVFAAVQAGGAVHGIGEVMSGSQVVTYAVVNTIYVPCVATIAVLGRELGWRATAAISGGTVVTAILVGGVVARLLP